MSDKPKLLRCPRCSVEGQVRAAEWGMRRCRACGFKAVKDRFDQDAGPPGLQWQEATQPPIVWGQVQPLIDRSEE